MKPSILYNGYKNNVINRIKLKFFESLFNVADKLQSRSFQRNNYIFELASKIKQKAWGEIIPF